MYKFTKQEDGNFIFEKTITSFQGGKRNDTLQKVYDLSKDEVITAAKNEMKIWEQMKLEAEHNIDELNRELKITEDDKKNKK